MIKINRKDAETLRLNKYSDNITPWRLSGEKTEMTQINRKDAETLRLNKYSDNIAPWRLSGEKNGYRIIKT